MNPSLSAMFVNLDSSYPGLFRLVFLCFYLAGFFSVIWGIYNFKNADSDRYQKGGVSSPVVGSMISILIGGVLCYMPTLLESVATTMFAQVSPPAGMMDYQTPTSIGGNSFVSLRTFCQLIGVYTFGRGWLSLRHVGVNGDNGRHTFYGAVVRIFAGISLVHIVEVLRILSASFGFHIISTWLDNFGG